MGSFHPNSNSVRESSNPKFPKAKLMRIGGLILCGGKSSRMTLPKATLPFGPELMLGRVVRLLAEAVHPIVVVAAPSQTLPALPHDVLVARDEQEGLGPLAGLAAGLAAISSRVDAVYATSCDVPLLVPEFVRRMIEELGENEIAVPVDGEFHHPLASVYRTSVLMDVRELLVAQRLRPFFLFERRKTRRVPIADLKSVDPHLHTLMNLNFPADYLDALRLAGFEPDPAVLQRLMA
jgi:molybdopterin-guanine dinucleotide biosynthesis protein A